MAPREGGFSEYITMPERNLVTVPDDIALSVAALAEPIACGWHAVRKAKAVLNRKDRDIRALVIGGGGNWPWRCAQLSSARDQRRADRGAE